MQVGNGVGDLSDRVDDLELDQAVAGSGTGMSLLEGHSRECCESGGVGLRQRGQSFARHGDHLIDLDGEEESPCELHESRVDGVPYDGGASRALLPAERAPAVAANVASSSCPSPRWSESGQQFADMAVATSRG